MWAGGRPGSRKGDTALDDDSNSMVDLILDAARRGAPAPAPAPPPAGPAGPPPPPHPPAPEADHGLESVEHFRQELAKKSDPMPVSPAERYRPHADFLNRLKTPERTFYCVFRDCTNQGFPYAHFDGIRLERSKRDGGGLVLVVRFNGSEIEEVWIEGRNLRFIEICVGMGIMPWIWELPAGRKDEFPDHATVITHITPVKIERK
jgi:hypothetical protein